jgi:type II secretory pathway component PulF
MVRRYPIAQTTADDGTIMSEEIVVLLSKTPMEPPIIIFLGLVVGMVLIAMYLPVFQKSKGF